MSIHREHLPQREAERARQFRVSSCTFVLRQVNWHLPQREAERAREFPSQFRRRLAAQLRQHASTYIQDTSAYVSIRASCRQLRQHTSTYVIRQDTSVASAYLRHQTADRVAQQQLQKRQHFARGMRHRKQLACQHTSAYIRITSAYVSMRCRKQLACQHTSAYVGIRQHTSAYAVGSSLPVLTGTALRLHTSAYVSIRQHAL